MSYIFGTHHAFGKDFFDSLSTAKQKLLTSEILIKENLNVPGHMAEDIINHRTTQTNWPRYLSKEDHQYIENIFANSKVDFNKMTPTELHVFLSRFHKEKVCKSKTASDTYLSLDDYIGKVATENNLKLVGLETTEEQLEIIRKDVEGMPRKVHKKRLANLIERIESDNTDGCSEIEWYRNMNFDYRFSQPCQNTLVLTERNDKWMSKITSQIRTNNSFIAVGLSHLMFECGLINQLRKSGYTVTPVPAK